MPDIVIETRSEDAGNGWSRPSASFSIDAHRGGWRGAWDAFVAALLRRPRLTVPRELTMSMCVKPGGQPDAQIQYAHQAEIGPADRKK